MSESKTNSFEVAAAINQVMHLDPADQASMLDVIADYFTNPDHASDDEDSSCSDSDTDFDDFNPNPPSSLVSKEKETHEDGKYYTIITVVSSTENKI